MIACSDELALAAAELPDGLAERFPSFQPDASVLRMLVDKGAFLHTLEELDVPHPRTHVVDAYRGPGGHLRRGAGDGLHQAARLAALPEGDGREGAPPHGPRGLPHHAGRAAGRRPRPDGAGVRAGAGVQPLLRGRFRGRARRDPHAPGPPPPAHVPGGLRQQHLHGVGAGGRGRGRRRRAPAPARLPALSGHLQRRVQARRPRRHVPHHRDQRPPLVVRRVRRARRDGRGEARLPGGPRAAPRPAAASTRWGGR